MEIGAFHFPFKRMDMFNINDPKYDCVIIFVLSCIVLTGWEN